MASVDVAKLGATVNGGTGAVTVSVTSNGTGSRVAVVLVETRATGGKTTTDVITCTYAGTNMTLIASGNDGNIPGIGFAVFALANPTLGTQSVIATDTTDSTVSINASVVVLLNAKVPAAAQVAHSVQSAVTTASQTPVAPGANDVVVWMGATDTGGAGFTAGGQGASETNIGVDNTGSTADIASDYRLGSAGTGAMTHTLSSGNVQNVSVTVQDNPQSGLLPMRIPNPKVGPMALRHAFHRARQWFIPPASGATDVLALNVASASTVAFTTSGTDALALSVASGSTVGFTTSGTDVLALAVTGQSAVSFTTSGKDVIALTIVSQSTPSFSLAGMTDPFTLGISSRSTIAFTTSGVDALPFSVTSRSTVAITLRDTRISSMAVTSSSSVTMTLSGGHSPTSSAFFFTIPAPILIGLLNDSSRTRFRSYFQRAGGPFGGRDPLERERQ